MDKRELTAKTKRMLLKLADFLKTEVRPKWFNLGSWSTRKFLEKECGTTACAGGWSTVCFPRSGLKLVVSREVGESFLELAYGKYRGLDAAAEFFGIDDDTARCLFYPDYYPGNRSGRMDVVRRIRRIVKNPSVVDTLITAQDIAWDWD